MKELERWLRNWSMCDVERKVQIANRQSSAAYSIIIVVKYLMLLT